MRFGTIRKTICAPRTAVRRAGLKLLLSALAVTAPIAAEAATLITFGGRGTGVADIGVGPRLGVVENGVSGSVFFDPALASPFGPGLRLVTSGFYLGFRADFEAQVQGDTLFIRLDQATCRDSPSCTASASFRDSLNLAITFRDGSLNNSFPTTASLADVESSFYSAINSGCNPRCEFYSSRGTLTEFALTTSAGGGGIGRGFFYVGLGTVPAVPEPATWATMLLGFGAVGSAMRSARRQRLASLGVRAA